MLQYTFPHSMISLAVASACAMMALPAQSQDSAATPAPGTTNTTSVDTDRIQEVKVTATRHSTSLLRTPVAVSTMSQASLSRAGIADARGLSGEVPSLQISSGTDSGVQISIRGVSSNNFTEIGDPAVGLHINGLYSPRPQGALALMFDLENVEVLRGPQGTLFGRNSTGGSVNIIPAKPEFGNNHGSTNLSLGNYNERQLNLTQNIAINEQFALRANFMKIKRDGWINQKQDFTDVDLPERGFHKDVIPDVDQRYNRKVDKADYYYNKNEWAGRLSARWAPTRDFEWNLAYEKFQNGGAGDIYLKDCDQAAGTRFACTGGKWDVNINVPGKIDMSIATVRSGMSWNLNANTRLEYGYAHAVQSRSQYADDDAGYHPLASQVTARRGVNPDAADHDIWPVLDNTSRTLDSRFVSDVHELQLKHSNERFQTVAGLFWMHEKNQINYAQEQLVSAPYGLPRSQYYNQPNRQIDAKALFAQTDWKFAPGWTATIGARFSRDSKADRNGKVFGGNEDPESTAYYNGQYQPGTPGEPGFKPHNGTDLTPSMGPLAGLDAYRLYKAPAQNDHAETWKKVTWKLGLMKQISPTDMVYTSLATGYKAGGFGDKDDICNNHHCVTGPAGPQYSFFPYKPETVTNLELGYKGSFLDNRLSLRGALFYSRYKDMQVTGELFSARIIPDAPCTSDNIDCDIAKKYQTINVGVVDIPGLELEVEYKPWKGAKLGGFFSWIGSKVKSFPGYSDEWNCDVRAETGAPACPPPYNGSNREFAGRQLYDITGNQLPLAPRYSFGINFSQVVILADNYTLTPWVSLKWQDKMYFSLRNLNNSHISDAQAAYTKIDASIKLTAPKLWHAELYVLNLLDKRSKNSIADGNGFVKATWNDPRTFGLRVGFEY